VGLEDRLDHFPAQLSGGERQRVALARALIRKPPLVVCDEPTGNLDRESAVAITSLLFTLHAQQNNVLLIVTHNPELANRCSIRYRLDNQKLAIASD
jgi:predicted ABC-type transport system involved in lysophospholipase L1 biosynthesis ATPase subunit